MSDTSHFILWAMCFSLAIGSGWLVNHMFTMWMARKPGPLVDDKRLMAAWEQVDKLTKEVEDLKGRVNGITLRMGMK